MQMYQDEDRIPRQYIIFKEKRGKNENKAGCVRELVKFIFTLKRKNGEKGTTSCTLC